MTKRPNSTSRALAVTRPQTKQGNEQGASKVPTAQDLIVPAALMIAADHVSERKDEKKFWAHGVFLHAVDGKPRVVGTDGVRLFVAASQLATDGGMPEWLEPGIILSNEGLKARVGMIARGVETAHVRIRYASGMPKAEVSDLQRDMVFQVPVITAEFPNYDKAIGPSIFARLDEDGEVARGTEWEPVGINSAFLKHIGEVAKTLEAGLPKNLRTQAGMVVRAFGGDGKRGTPMVFDFSTWPGALMVVAPAKLASPIISAATAALLAPALKASVAALRAHATRNLAWADEAPDEASKAAFTAKAEGFQARVAELLKRAPGVSVPELAAPEPATPEPATDETATETAVTTGAEPEGQHEEQATEDQRGEEGQSHEDEGGTADVRQRDLLAAE